ncbi:protein SPT2 homolog [Gymnodraco acuticeps]|uniref:Protein SPT2 homolog n=1 Tax=Gymnodraco acuticeps TaxID=8218 RepID=A0A6P8U986_GYMAC|nr:protein SPT2 homolog [Gymnodraco acuticeps]
MILWISCLLIGYITCHPIQQETAAPRFMHWPPPSSYRYWERRASSDPGSSSYLPVVPVLRSNKAPELPALQEASSSAGPGNYRAPAYAGNGYNSNIQVVDYGSSARPGLSSEPAGEEEPKPVFSEVAGPALLEASSSAGPGNYRAPAYAGNGYNSNIQVVDYGSSARPGLSSEPAGEEEPKPVFSEVAGPALLEASSSAGPGNYRAPAYAGNGYNSNIQVVDYGSSARPGLSSEPAGEEEPEPVFSEVAGLEPVSSFSSRSRYQRKRSQVAQTRYIPGEPVPWHAPSKYVF